MVSAGGRAFRDPFPRHHRLRRAVECASRRILAWEVSMRKLFVFLVSAACAIGSSALVAQQPQQGPTVVSPDVQSDRRVTFRILAPNAQKVELRAPGDIPGIADAAARRWSSPRMPRGCGKRQPVRFLPARTVTCSSWTASPSPTRGIPRSARPTRPSTASPWCPAPTSSTRRTCRTARSRRSTTTRRRSAASGECTSTRRRATRRAATVPGLLPAARRG